MSRTKKIMIAVALLFAYWFCGGEVIPQPEPTPQRPVLRWLAKAARNLLWTAAFFEPAPEPRDGDVRVVHSKAVELDADGVPVVNHVRGY
jgi:hypothetical protein